MWNDDDMPTDRGDRAPLPRTTRPANSRQQARLAGYEHGPGATVRATEAALARVDDARTIVLVEGISDQIALETLSLRLGRTVAERKVVVVPIGGAHAIKHFVPRFAGTPGVRLCGLCDRAESVYFAQALLEHGLIGAAGDTDLERAGFYVCDADLEDELIRSIDDADIESVLAAEGDLGAFSTLQKQPGWRDQPFRAQLHRWLRSGARRNMRYARLLVLEAGLDRMPRPLLALAERF